MDDSIFMSSTSQEQLQARSLSERALLVACHLPRSRFDARDPLGELRALADTAGATVVGEAIQNRRTPEAGTYLGTGKLEELKRLVEVLEATLVIFDNDLSPSQIRNIEKILGVKIIDRSELILDIFANRATTAAARLQVELAQMEYTYPRLRAMWSHLGQITGGAPLGIGTRGPGETQIETDRRLVQHRKTVLKTRLAEVLARRVREVAHRRAEHRTVCLVGYTNAGKSTIFNALTGPAGGGGAYADDRLFATLTTRTRRWPLGSGQETLLSDTVGFVRDLPHHLIASFRATLEEAIHADLLLLVIDISDPMAAMQYDIVCETLTALRRDDPLAQHAQPANSHSAVWVEGQPEPVVPAIDPDLPRHILVLNKADRLDDEAELALWHQRDPSAIAISAKTGRGLDELRQIVQERLMGELVEIEFSAPYSAAKAISYAESRGEVIDRDYETDGVRLKIRIGRSHLDRLRSMGLPV